LATAVKAAAAARQPQTTTTNTTDPWSSATAQQHKVLRLVNSNNNAQQHNTTLTSCLVIMYDVFQNHTVRLARREENDEKTKQKSRNEPTTWTYIVSKYLCVLLWDESSVA
jgi:hypothetical protein